MAHHDNNKHIWYVSLNDEDYEIAEDRFIKSGCKSKAKYTRDFLTKGKVKVVIRESVMTKDDVTALRQLSKLGKNINTLIRKINMDGGTVETAEEAAKLVIIVKEILDDKYRKDIKDI
jgi:hypothetical protein